MLYKCCAVNPLGYGVSKQKQSENTNIAVTIFGDINSDSNDSHYIYLHSTQIFFGP